MSATLAPPPILSKTVAMTMLDGAWEALDKALDERADCPECQARHGWCEVDSAMDYAREAIAGAQSQVRRSASDRQAAEITFTLVQVLAGKRYGAASQVALAGVIAGGAQ